MIATVKRHLRLILTWERAVLWALLSFLAALAGPFGSYGAGKFPVFLAYWACVIGSTMIISVVLIRTVLQIGAGWRPVVVDIVVVVLVTVIISPVVLGWTRLFFDFPAESRPGLGDLAFFVAGVSATIRVLRHLAAGFDSAAYFMPRSMHPPRLSRRLGDGFKGPILRLSARDHSVDVISARDSGTIRMRLGDAIDEMDNVPGVLTHRSHWVARAAVAGSQRDGGRIYLRLTNGDLVPVSRTYKDALENDGLL